MTLQGKLIGTGRGSGLGLRSSSRLTGRSRGSYRVPAWHRILRRTGPSLAVSLILVVTWIGLTGVLLGAGELVTHWSVIERFDRHITSWVVAHRSHALDATMKVVTWCGSWVAVAVTGGPPPGLAGRSQAAVGCCHPGRRRLAGRGHHSQSRQDLGRSQTVHHSSSGWSPLTGPRFRPGMLRTQCSSVPPWGLSGASSPYSWAARLTGVVVSVVGILTVGFSRVELGVHWMTDVVASVPRGCRVAGRHRASVLLSASHSLLPFRPRREPATGQSGHPDVPAFSPDVVGPDH